ncbi:DUF2062 domain-containing protein [Granulicella sp. WH15]|uniref:DUF2062 domain-containing protein n=1 Tax=Granulicella sp. WH15 TaxID=2602070 RepID=UPI001366CDE3|nr:DUF2062 domain-containing protein [Granulicella sp. WH15]QHN04607.1 DUF2062 domain-containing protein [Granulicella sp. WH15]
MDETVPKPEPTIAARLREIGRRRIVTPLLDLMRVGATPQRLAWSLAVGAMIGINPLLGTTTLLALLAAGVFRLNLVASQIANHVVYPLQIVLFFVFIRLGDRLFHTGRMPLKRAAIFEGVRHHPWDTTRLLWTWEWHAVVVWAVAAVVIAPVLALVLTPMLKRLLASMERRSATRESSSPATKDKA